MVAKKEERGAGRGRLGQESSDEMGVIISVEYLVYSLSLIILFCRHSGSCVAIYIII